ncbi:Hypothetical protein PFR_JS9-2_360 [Propionibacterium freudenreichii]|nr:Hypothetical protein PFR_JS9-1_362 [Propionibacterium freudenreichii]SCQ66686.1 Hypothetical protein PFR_JS9-2_360 [Propionibacterium freudenreichii]SCQ76345.1 Hypothetical protein PFR_JS20-1_2028 [Propionibacterium freudenreichii]SCQ83237.1 Hypothetical protein PFR_JS20-2_2036 [Propionibacterium freudenreichii]
MLLILGLRKGFDMARNVKVVLIDDVDGGDADQTINFGLDGVNYEIDLSNANAQKMRDELAVWVGHGRRVTGRRGAAARKQGPSDAAKIREWAKSTGRQVPLRGRIPNALRAEYEEATK